jgi:hypothetical protein
VGGERERARGGNEKEEREALVSRFMVLSLRVGREGVVWGWGWVGYGLGLGMVWGWVGLVDR